MASRRVLEAFDGFTELHPHDRSRAAHRYAADAARLQFPDLNLASGPPRTDESTLLVVSHVLNELTPPDVADLLRLARDAGEILWVEAGAHADSRALIDQIREPLRSTHRVIAPCTHSESCGLLSAENAPHWCHSFARAPSPVFQDPNWSEFSRALGIDLRALPFSFLAMTRRPPDSTDHPPARVIGRPRQYKGYAKVLRCDATGVEDIRIQKRDDKARWNFLKDLPTPPLFHPPS